MVSIEAQILNSRKQWFTRNFSQPDTIILNSKSYYNLIRELREKPFPFFPEADGNYKYMGMDFLISESVDDFDVRVCRTKL